MHLHWLRCLCMTRSLPTQSNGRARRCGKACTERWTTRQVEKLGEMAVGNGFGCTAMDAHAEDSNDSVPDHHVHVSLDIDILSHNQVSTKIYLPPPLPGRQYPHTSAHMEPH